MGSDEEAIELDISEEDILFYLVDEDDNEVGFVIEEDGIEVECYYDDVDPSLYEVVAETEAPKPASGEDDEGEPGYLEKIAAIAGHEGGKARKVAEEKIDVVRGKAEKSAKRAAKTATEKAKEAKAHAEEIDLGITREDMADMTQDLNAVAKEGLETARELKDAYDDIMGTFDFLSPKRKSGFSSGGPGMPGFRK